MGPFAMQCAINPPCRSLQCKARLQIFTVASVEMSSNATYTHTHTLEKSQRNNSGADFFSPHVAVQGAGSCIKCNAPIPRQNAPCAWSPTYDARCITSPVLNFPKCNVIFLPRSIFLRANATMQIHPPPPRCAMAHFTPPPWYAKVQTPPHTHNAINARCRFPPSLKINAICPLPIAMQNLHQCNECKVHRLPPRNIPQGARFLGGFKTHFAPPPFARGGGSRASPGMQRGERAHAPGGCIACIGCLHSLTHCRILMKPRGSLATRNEPLATICRVGERMR